MGVVRPCTLLGHMSRTGREWLENTAECMERKIKGSGRKMKAKKQMTKDDGGDEDDEEEEEKEDNYDNFIAIIDGERVDLR